MFVTGTDTGVGKTVVSSAILAAFSRRGLAVAALKPVETGCAAGQAGGDCQRLARVTGQLPDEVASYSFGLPAAPLVAAEAEGAVISVDKIIGDFRLLTRDYDFVLVEGAGGIAVPIVSGVTYLDLARELGAVALCVVASRLGCINHTLLTLGTLEAGGVGVAGYVVNELGDGSADASIASNRELIARFTTHQELGRFPPLDGPTLESPAALGAVAEDNLNLEALLAASLAG
ncbi:MAG: dethiobiotin synthase [Candidatus Binatia bacterium]